MSHPLETLSQEIKKCRKCSLYRGRKNAVPGEGNYKASILLVGEAPGEQEDLQGRPFVGRAGNLLDSLLQEIGIDRSSIFITNVVKCRPPGNRDPQEEEIKSCLPYLRQQVAEISPRLICVMGRIALKTLLRTGESISHLHGRFFPREKFTFFVTYHPAAALYNNQTEGILRSDFRILGKFLRESELLEGK